MFNFKDYSTDLMTFGILGKRGIFRLKIVG